MNQMRKRMTATAATVTMDARIAVSADDNPPPPPPPPSPPSPPSCDDVGVGNIDVVGLAVKQLASCVDVPLT
jgi:hypothetical protein